jgi:hypothetical protein
MLTDNKLETAIEAAKLIVDSLPETQRITLIAFQSRIHLLVDNVQATEAEKDAIKAQIDSIRYLTGGSTNMTGGIKEAIRSLAGSKSSAKVLLVLSDGAADDPDTASLSAAAASEAGIQLFCVGFGANYEADHLLKLVRPSNGTVFGDSEVAKIKETFAQLMGRIESFVATNVFLDVTFDADVQAGLAYKASPEQAFLGNMRPDASRTVRFNVGNIERDKAYGFLFLPLVPKREEGEFEVGRAVLTYDIPSQQISGARLELPIRVEYTQDRRAAEEVDGEVMEVFRRTSITQLTDRFVEAYKQSDSEQTAKYLKILVRRYEEIGDTAMKNHYETTLFHLKEEGVITNEMLNASVVASTVVAGGGELPQLVDDGF